MKLKSYKLLPVIGGLAALLVAAPALAHAIVSPDQVGIGSLNNFSLGIPTEKDVPTTAVKLLVPGGLDEVTPNVKAGWKITVKQNGSGDDAPVTEIDWTGGQIPVGQRDQFFFSAEVPASPTTLIWKAYQTYADGSVVSWDQTPAQEQAAGSDATPYSTTKVVNDLTATPVKTDRTPLYVSLAALLVACVALAATTFGRGPKSSAPPEK